MSGSNGGGKPAEVQIDAMTKISRIRDLQKQLDTQNVVVADGRRQLKDEVGKADALTTRIAELLRGFDQTDLFE